MSSPISAVVLLHLGDSREMVSAVCTYVLRESGKLCASGFWREFREVNVTNYLCDVLKQSPLGFPVGSSGGVFQRIPQLILFDFALSSGLSEVACIRTFAFSSLISVRRAAGEWSNGPGSVRSKGVMADFLYIFSSFRSFYKTSSHQKSPPDTAHPCTGVHSCLILSFFFSFKATAPNLGLPFALGDKWKSSHEYPMH